MPFKPHFSWEFLSKEEIDNRSVRAIKNHIDYLKRDSLFYQNKLEGISSADINTIDDIQTIPITTKEEFIQYEADFKVASDDQIIETIVTSGSTGTPLMFPFTASDLDRIAYNESLAFHGAGISSKDRALIMVPMDQLLFAGISFYRGLTALGVNTARSGVISFEKQKHFIELIKPTVVVGVPSYLLKLGEQLISSGVNLHDSTIEKVFCVGEPIRDEDMNYNHTALSLEELYGAEIYSTYESTEVASTFCECSERSGGHSRPELVFAEILDDGGNPVPDGEVGELVVTPLGVEGMPLLRYRTGDLTFKIPGNCECGRHSMRIGPILSRTSEQIEFKGNSIYAQTITNVLDSIPGVVDYIIELKGREGSSSEEIFIHAATKPTQVQVIMTKVQQATRITIPVLISNAATINSMRGDKGGKVRVIDTRTKS